MRANFLNILFALALLGGIFLSSYLLRDSRPDNVLPQAVGSPTPADWSASLPSAVKLPDLAPAVTPYLVVENNSQFYPIRNWDTPSIELKAESALAADFSSERFFYQKNIDEPRPIASITKLMTALITLENYNLDDVVKIVKEDVEIEGDLGGLAVDEELSLRSLFHIMLIESSNDAAFALARDMGLQKFVGLMNQKAKDLGLVNTRFVDPAGLNSEGNVSSARDLEKLIKYLFTVWPGAADITKTQNADISSVDGKKIHHLKNSNKLLEKRPEILGGKTGFTDKAGECLTLLVQLDASNKIITIVLDSPDRFGESERLVNWLKIAYIWR